MHNKIYNMTNALQCIWWYVRFLIFKHPRCYRSRQSCLPRVRTTQRRRRRDSWDASGALSEMVLGETRRRARATSAEQQATVVASQRLRRAWVERMGQGRSRGERRRDVERRDPTWPERVAQRRCAAPRGGRSLLPVGHDWSEHFVSVFIESDWQANFDTDYLLIRSAKI